MLDIKRMERVFMGRLRGGTVMLDMKKIEEMDSHWKEVMDLAVKYGFVRNAYAGMAILLTHKNQLEAEGEEKYIYLQKGMNGIDVTLKEE